MTEEQTISLVEEDKRLATGWKDGAIFNLDFLSASIKVPIDDWEKVKQDLRKIIDEN